jgi:hypothetical protein
MGYRIWKIVERGDGQFAISYILSAIFCPDLVGALADGVKEVGDYPPSRQAQGAPLRRAGPIFQFALEER